VSTDKLGAGAGEIVKPGAKQVYSFEATPGQKIFVENLSYGEGMYRIGMHLLDANGDEVAHTVLGGNSIGAQTLKAGGTYSLVVGSDGEPTTGPYDIQVTVVP
jgi:hypothetical protein